MSQPIYFIAKKSSDPDSLFQRTAGAPECGILHRQLPSTCGETPAELLDSAGVGDRIVKVRGEAGACFICEVTHEVVRKFWSKQLKNI